ncbi:MAG: AsmA family protein [Beijerinckiaceae bacterium]
MPTSPSRTDKSQETPARAPEGPRGLWTRYVWVENRRSRGLRLAGLALAAIGLGAAIAPWTVSRGALREEIAAQLRSSSGLYVFTQGPSVFSLLPRPSIDLQKISFVDPRGALVIEADRMVGHVRWLPLLAGRLELDRAELHRPRLVVDVDGRPLTAAGAVVRAADARPSTPEAAKADAARLGIVSFVDGEATLRRRGAVVDRLDHIDATLDWRTVASAAALDGEAEWRGQRGALSVWIARPSDMLRGETSPLTFDLKSPALRISANGSAAASPRPQFEGRLVASAPSVRGALRILGADTPLPLTLGAATLDARADVSPTAINLGALKLGLDGADYEGALSWRTDDARPSLSGTLATRTIDLREALRYLPSPIGDDGHFSGEPIAWRDRDAFDLDLRISAARVSWDRLVARDVAGAILLRNGRLEASLADASLYKGDLKARLVLTPDATGRVELKSTLQARGIDWAAFGWDRFGDSHVSGLASAHLTMEGAGSSFAQIARSLSGRGDLDIAKGDIIGLDVERALRRIERKPLASAVDIRNGRTNFERAHVAVTIADGIATLDDGAIEAPGFVIGLAGAAQIAERQINLRATVSSIDEKSDKPRSPAFAFDIAGPWDHADIVPDARGLIRRSGAAQPLFAPRAEDRRSDKPADEKND